MFIAIKPLDVILGVDLNITVYKALFTYYIQLDYLFSIFFPSTNILVA